VRAYKCTPWDFCDNISVDPHIGNGAWLNLFGGVDIARPDNAAPYSKGGHRETGHRGTRLNRSQRVEHPSAQEKFERAER